MNGGRIGKLEPSNQRDDIGFKNEGKVANLSLNVVGLLVAYPPDIYFIFVLFQGSQMLQICLAC